MKKKSHSWRPSPAMISICACIGVMLFAGLVYYGVLLADFVNQDDYHYVFKVGRVWSPSLEEVGNVFTQGRFGWPPTLQDLKETLTGGRIHRPSNTSGYYQPLVALTFMLDAYLTKDWLSRAFQFHLTNLSLHLTNVALIFALVRRLSSSHLWAVLLSLLFALHPVQVESVAWVAQRMTLLGCTFTLLALHCYVRYAQALRLRWLIPVVPFFAAAILCRPLFIGLPIVLLILDVWPFRRHERHRNQKKTDGRLFLRPFVEKTPLFAIMLLSAIIQFNIRSENTVTHTDGVSGAELISHNAAALASRLVFPLKLSPYHPLATTVGGTALGRLFDIGVLAFIVVALVGSFWRWKPVFAALAGALVLTLPALLQAPFNKLLLSDQYLYGVLIIPLIALAAWLKSRPDALKKTWGRWTAILFIAVLVIFSVQTYAQTQVWQSSRALFKHTISLYPDWSFGHISLVESYIRENSYEAALKAAERALKVEPDNPSTQFYIGTVLLLHQDGRSSEAIAPLESALTSNPNWIECLQNLGVALARSARTEEAIDYFEKARDLKPRAAGVRIGLGNAYLKVNRFASARAEFQEALKHRNDSSAHFGLAIAWAANNVPEHARRHLTAAIAKDPKMATKAGRSQHLRRLQHLPGFEALIEDSGEAVLDDVLESPAARRAHGS
ncbi:MAG: tetratricopeptide repeat protein [Phycisphaerales bacterium]|nr:tetratricopeptide repeat protein [Phycisphaerales bacterium]